MINTLNMEKLETILKLNKNEIKIKKLYKNSLFEDDIDKDIKNELSFNESIKNNVNKDNSNTNNLNLLELYNNISVIDYKERKNKKEKNNKNEKKMDQEQQVEQAEQLPEKDVKNKNMDTNSLLSLLDTSLKGDNTNSIMCKLNECLELPIIFNKIIDNKTNYYRMGVLDKNSFFHSLMCILDPMYNSYTILNRQKEIDCLFTKLLFEMPKMWDKYNYRKIGFRREEIQNKLNLYKKIDRSIQRYVSDYFNLNIFVVKIKYNKFYICSDYKEELVSILLLENNDIFEPVLNENGMYYFKNIYKKLNSCFTFESLEEKKIKEICVSDEKEKELKIKLLKKEKVNIIYELCYKLDITLESGLGKKKKTKEELIKEISKCM